MKKRSMKIITFLTLLFLITGIFIACSNHVENKDNGQKESEQNIKENESQDIADGETKDISESEVAKELSGTITMAGSTSMEKLANAAAEAFMNKYPKVSVSAEFIGSSAGIEAVLAGTVNIGNASRNLKDTEKSSGAVENIVAIDGIAVILHKTNSIINITKEHLIQIYTGEIKNWSEVGGTDEPIVVIGREAGSGTRGAFEELLGIEDKCSYSNEMNSTGGVLAKVASIPGAIGYVSLDILDDTVIAASIDGVEPTEENIRVGEYLLSRPFVMATLGNIKEQDEEVQAFFDFLSSEEGKELIKSVGLIPVD